MFELVKLVAGLLSLLILLTTIKQVQNRYLVFIVSAIWLRFFLSAFHTITYPKIIAGFSINALASICVVAIGLLLLPKSVFLLRKYLIFYAYFAIIATSGLLNGELVGTINVLVKWGYFFVVSSSILLALRSLNSEYVLKHLLVAFILPVSLQILSIVFGETKITDGNGLTSYVGGYYHEAAFSMILVSVALILSWLQKNALPYQSICFVAVVLLLVLVNYRTTILAILPITIFFIFTSIGSNIDKRYRLPTFILLATPLSFLGLIISSSMAERFADISLFLGNMENLIKAPIYFTEWEKDIFSARVYIWSQYLSSFFNADWLKQLFGFGPESWSGVFDKYAHNTLVSYLYEYGYLGTILFCAINIQLIKEALKHRQSLLGYKLAFSLIGFLIMSQATMPLWNIEGLISFALICAFVFDGGKQYAAHSTMDSKAPLIHSNTHYHYSPQRSHT